MADTQRNMNTGATNSYGYIDSIISFQCISIIQRIIDSGAFTLRNIIIIALILSFDGIRKCLSKIFESIDVIEYMKNIKNMIFVFIKGRRFTDSTEEDFSKDFTPFLTLTFLPTLSFWEGVLFRTKDESEIQVTYTKTSDKALYQKNLYEYTIKETYTNIAIESPNFNVYFKNSVDVSVSYVNGHAKIEKVKLVNYTNNNLMRDNLHASTFADILPFPAFAKEFKKLVYNKQKLTILTAQNTMHVRIRYGSSIRTFTDFLQMDSCTINATDNQIDEKIKIQFSDQIKASVCSPIVDIYLQMVPTLEKKYVNWDHFESLYQLVYLCAMCNTYMNDYQKTYRDRIWTSKCMMFLGCNIKEAIKKFRKSTKDFLFLDSGKVLRKEILELPDSKEVQKYMLMQFFPELDNEIFTSNGELPSSEAEMILYGDMNTWIQYVQEISNTSKTLNNALTEKNEYESQIYILKVINEECTERYPNPEYEEWEVYVETLKNSGCQNATIPPPPAKLCTKIKHVTNVNATHINDIYKDMSNLYLRKKDKARLMNCLLQFREKKALMKALGIPNKLGVLLYGEPGTGKSSTIHAIASFLKKNIYYIQLNEVQSNEQLHMLFNYVTKNCTEGGIIVMEDIDAMTNVVHKRDTSEDDETYSQTSSQISEASKSSSKLTLEFFLNILQGSLTAEGTIFITTTNHIEKLDPAFYRDGRFDVRIEMKAANHYQIQEIFERFFERQLSLDIIKRIPEYTYTPATFIARFRGFLMESNVSDEEIMEPFFE